MPAAKVPIDEQAVIKDLLSTARAPIEGYPSDGYSGPGVQRVGVPMSHHGHGEKPGQLPGGTLAAVTWLTSESGWRHREDGR